jgi:hypothetical protein
MNLFVKWICDRVNKKWHKVIFIFNKIDEGKHIFRGNNEPHSILLVKNKLITSYTHRNKSLTLDHFWVHTYTYTYTHTHDPLKSENAIILL